MANEIRSFYPLYLRSSETPPLGGGGPSTVVAGTLAPSVTVAATDAAPTASARFPGTDKNTYVQIQIANVSTTLTSWAYVSFGVFGAVPNAAVATSYPIPPGAVVVVSVDPEVTGASVILGTAASAANVIFTRGEGI